VGRVVMGDWETGSGAYRRSVDRDSDNMRA